MGFATNAHVELYYETFGEPGNETLLIVSGLGSQCINVDTALIQKFVDRGFFVVRYDNRDVGLSTQLDDFTPRVSDVVTAVRSGKPADVPYRLSDMASDAAAVLDAVEVPVAHVMGMSMGGMIVQQLAIDHPQRLRSMTSIMSTTGDPDVGQSSAEVAALFYAPPGTDRASVIANTQALERLYTSPGQFDVERSGQRIGAAFDRCFSPRGVARQLAAIIASGNRSDALRTVRVPALVIHGDADTLIDVSGGARTAQCIPGARFVEIAGMGHDLAPIFWDRIVQLVSGHALASMKPKNIF